MSYPIVQKLRDAYIQIYNPSIGGTPVACYGLVPFRGQVIKVSAVTQGTITTADCTVAFAVNGTANTAGNLTIPVASAAGGEVAEADTTSPINVNAGDYITLTPSGASGSNIACIFTVKIREA